MYNKDSFFELLEKRKISNKELASAIGVSTGNVSDWKSGKSKPNIDAISKIADYLCCSVDFLLGRENAYYSRSIDIARKISGQLDLGRDAFEAKFGNDTYKVFFAWVRGNNDYFDDKLLLLADFFNININTLLGQVAFGKTDLADYLDDEDTSKIISIIIQMLKSDKYKNIPNITIDDIEKGFIPDYQIAASEGSATELDKSTSNEDIRSLIDKQKEK